MFCGKELHCCRVINLSTFLRSGVKGNSEKVQGPKITGSVTVPALNFLLFKRSKIIHIKCVRTHSQPCHVEIFLTLEN